MEGKGRVGMEEGRKEGRKEGGLPTDTAVPPRNEEREAGLLEAACGRQPP